MKIVTVAMLLGAAGLVLSSGGTVSPLLLFAGGAASNVFGNLLTDGCMSAVDYFERARQDPTHAAHNFDVSVLAGRAISAIVKKALKDLPAGYDGEDFLSGAAGVEPGAYAKAIESESLGGLYGDRLMQVLGAPHGGIDERAATASVWYRLLEIVLTSGPAGSAFELPKGTKRQALAFAARRLWERFPAQFNGELRNDKTGDGRAWIAVQSHLLRQISDTTARHFESHKQLKAEFRALSLWITGSADRLSAQAASDMLNAGGSLRDQLEELRVLAYTNLHKVDAALKAVHVLQSNVAALRDLIAGGPKLKSLDETGGDAANMIFRARRVPLLARELELADLRAFLTAPQPVAWWLWHGPAGMGKSRLAFELCREVDRSWDDKPSSWLAGFLDIQRVSSVDWSAWEPKRPTLIVVDYASGKADKVGPWIAQLERMAREFKPTPGGPPRFPVRLLLLDRDADSKWLDRLRSSAGEPEFVDSARYADASGSPVPHRALPGFADEMLPEIVQAVYEARLRRGNKPAKPPLPKPNDVAQRYRKADLALRPLFVTLAAHAAFGGKQVEHMDELALVRDWWRDELRQWAKHLEEQNETTSAMLALRRLFAIATMAQGLPMDKGYAAFLAGVPDDDLRASLPSAQAYADHRDDWIKLLSPEGDADHAAIPPIEPDFFGEVFVLDHIRDYAKSDRQRRALLNVAGRATETGFAEWIQLASRDLPDNKCLQEVLRDLCDDVHPVPFGALSPIVQGNALAMSANAYGLERRPELADKLLRRAVGLFTLVVASGVNPPKANRALAICLYNLANVLRALADSGGAADPRRRPVSELYGEAEMLYREAMTADPGLAACRSNLANVLHAFAADGGSADPRHRPVSELYKEAEALYREAIAADPSDALTRYNLALMLRTLASRDVAADPKSRPVSELYEEAEAFYREAAANPGQAASRSSLASMLRTFADGGAADPRRRPAGALYEEAEALYREAMAADPGHHASGHNLANMLRQFADGGGAADPRKRPAGALYAEAELLYRGGTPSGMGAALSRPNLANMLRIFADGGGAADPRKRSVRALYEEAETLLREASAADASDAASRYYLAKMLRNFADSGGAADPSKRSAGALYEEAEVLFREAAAADAGDAFSRSDLANMLRIFADGGGVTDPKTRRVSELYEEAETLYREATAADRKQAVSRTNLASMLQDFADGGGAADPRNRPVGALYEEAEALYRDAMVVDGREAATRSNLALMLVGLVARGRRPKDELSRAESLFVQALHISPSNLPASMVLATLLLARRERDAGLMTLQMGLKIAHGASPGLFGLLAQALLYLHRLSDDTSGLLASIKQFLAQESERLPLLCLHHNAERAAADGHPEAAWLSKLATVLEGRAGVETLAGWESWERA